MNYQGKAISLLVVCSGIFMLHAAQIYHYDVPIVSIRAGNAWIINGNFKLVHVINITQYVSITENISALVEKRMPPSGNKDIINYHLTQTKERLRELGQTKTRNRRSIDWIGSAWKWVAGNPDAADWNSMLKSQNSIIDNNNEQYKINTQLLNTTRIVVEKTNELIKRFNEINNGREAEQIGQQTLNQVLVLKDAINEVVRACQLAKSGIINTNLLDKSEVENIITEIETLPYANAVEAIEYGNPSIYTNGALLLYVLSIPKLKKDFYHRILVRSPIIMAKQVELAFEEIIISQKETFGVKKSCSNINNATVCPQSALSRLKEESCIPRLLKGGAANCNYRMSYDVLIEMITTDILYVTNYKGIMTLPDRTEILNGTYLIQLFNESVKIGNETFSSISTTKLQPLPPVLTSVSNGSITLDIHQIHKISLNNIEKLRHLDLKMGITLGTYASFVILTIVCIGVLWYKLTGKLYLPQVDTSQTISSNSQPTHLVCGTQTFKEGGVSTPLATHT